MGRKKAVRTKKGGSLLNTIGGPIIPEKLYDLYHTGKIQGLKNIYDKTTEKTEEQLNKISKDLKNMQDVKNNEEEKNIHLTEVRNKKKIADDKLFQKTREDWYKMIFHDIGGTILTNVKGFATTAGSFAKNTLSLAANGGEGILFKLIIICIFIVIIVFLILGFTNSLPSADISNSNDITKSILTTDNENNFMNIKSGSLLTRFSNSLYNLVPNEYKYKFNSLNNSLSYITTGKNQYDDFLQPRNEITTGRNDDIFHISYKDKTSCILKPKDIEIKFTSYNNIDYNNINESLRDDINYPDTITLPFIANQKTHKYELDYSNQRYLNFNNDVTSKLDKNKFLFISKKNTIQLNSFANNNINNIAGVIAMYAPILINKSYKGPIMRIKISDKYRNIYYNNQNKKLYYKDELNIINYLDFDTYTYFNIHCLYDQTGNNHDYVFENNNDMDDKYPPMLVLKDTIFSIEFFSRSILYLSKKYPKIKSSIKTTIKFDADIDKIYQKGIKYNGNKKMSLLTNGDNNQNLIELEFDNIRLNKFRFNGTDYKFNEIYTIDKQVSSVLPLNNLYLSSIDGNNMYHGYLYKLEITTKGPYIFHYGVENYLSIVDNEYILLMIIDNFGKDMYLYGKKGDTKLYRNIEGINEFNEFNDLADNSYSYRDIKYLVRQTNTDLNNKDPYFISIDKDDIYKPSLVKRKGEYAIRFFRKSVLKLNDAMYDASKRDITKITAKILIEYGNCFKGMGAESYECKFANELDNIDKYMDLLASKQSSIITLDLKNPDNIYTPDGLNYNIKNRLYKKVDKINENNLLYDGYNKTTINIDIKDPSFIECLGVVHDIRSETNKTWDPANQGNKKERDDYIKKHSFIGNLYDLIIYKDI